MTERQLRELREWWNWTHERLESVLWAIGHLTDVKKSLEAECERLAEIIAEYDNTPIMTTDAAEGRTTAPKGGEGRKA